ncbi:MAG: hypothetical protein WCK29_01835 [archaeon]
MANTKKYAEPEYKGIVRLVGSTYITVSLFGRDNQEIITELPRIYFGNESLKRGDVFTYDLNTSIKKVPAKRPTDDELHALELEVLSQLPDLRSV